MSDKFSQKITKDTFVFVDLPLKSLSADITTRWHFWDGDDVKLIIDNEIQKNNSKKTT